MTSALEIAAAVSSRERSAAEVIDEHLTRIAERDKSIEAFRAVLDERARRRAAEVDKAVAGGASLPLAGVPIAVKDVLDLAGEVTTCGSKILEHYRPPFTATCIERLEARGAIVIGKTNMDEFAMGSSTEHSAYGKTKNPWDLGRVPGGSSGGSAAAVAANMAPLALGTDTGGSIRQPAALCGVVGLKPTYGRVSRYGLVAFASSLDQVGVFSRTVADAAATCEAMFGIDPLDSTSAPVPVGDLRSGLGTALSGLRIGVPRSVLAEGLGDEVRGVFEASLEVLRERGAELVDIELPHMHHAIATYYIVATAEASSNLARFDGVRYGLRAPGTGTLLSMYGASREAGFGDEGEAPHHARHVRAVIRLLRRLLRARPEGPHPHPPRLRGGIRQGRRDRHADHAQRRHSASAKRPTTPCRCTSPTTSPSPQTSPATPACPYPAVSSAACRSAFSSSANPGTKPRCSAPPPHSKPPTEHHKAQPPAG